MRTAGASSSLSDRVFGGILNTWTLATLALVCLSFSSLVSARWGAKGPYGGSVLSLAVSPSSGGTVGTNLFAGVLSDGGGMYLSTDNGARWSALDSGLTSIWVTSLLGDRSWRLTFHHQRHRLGSVQFRSAGLFQEI